MYSTSLSLYYCYTSMCPASITVVFLPLLVTITIYFLGLDTSEEFLSKNLIIKSQEMASCIYTKTILTAFLFLSSFSDSLNQRINPIRYTVRWTNKMRPFGSSSSVSSYLLPSYGPPEPFIYQKLKFWKRLRSFYFLRI